MGNAHEELKTLHDIKNMMEKSSRFISLSGLSGVAAGICALAGAAAAYGVLGSNNLLRNGAAGREYPSYTGALRVAESTETSLLWIGACTFVAAFVSAFLFTYIRSRRERIPIWGTSSRRLLINAGIPMLAGGIFLLRLMSEGSYGLIAPGCLIFYGLALVNASKYTMGEIRYLGYLQIVLGIINLWFVGYGLYFWAFGFGVLHILYGGAMWWRYERNTVTQ